MTSVPCSIPFSSESETGEEDDGQQFWGAGGMTQNLEAMNNVSKSNTIRRQNRHRKKKTGLKAIETLTKPKQGLAASLPVLNIENLFNLTQPPPETEPLNQKESPENLFNLTQPPPETESLSQPLHVGHVGVNKTLKNEADSDSDEWEDEEEDLMTPRQLEMNFPISKADFSLTVDARIRFTRTKKLPTSMRRFRKGGNFIDANRKNLNRWKRALSERALMELGLVTSIIKRDPGSPQMNPESKSSVALTNIVAQSSYVPEPLLSRNDHGQFSNLSLGHSRLEPILPCIADGFTSSSSSHSLDLSANRISFGRTNILSELSKYQSLRHLKLSSNLVGGSGSLMTRNTTAATGIASVLALKCLESLCMQNCNIGARCVQDIAHALKHSQKRTSSLLFLDLRRNKLDDSACHFLSQWFNRSTSDDMSREQEAATATTTNNNDGVMNVDSTQGIRLSNLKNLALDDNTITHKGLSQLIDALAEDCILKRLSISMNPLGIKSSTSISSLLERCPELTDLDLSWTRLKILGEELLDTLSKSKTLLHLSLSHNNMDSKECDALGECLRSNHTLLGLHVMVGNSCTVDWNGQIHSCPGIRTMATLAYEGMINVDGSGLGSQHCWLCEGWSEVQFQWTPGRSGSGSRRGVSLCLASEGWKPHKMNWNEKNKIWTLHLVLPPRTHRYMFALDEGFEFASDFPTTLSQLWPGDDGRCAVNVCTVAARPFDTTLQCQIAKPRHDSSSSTLDENEEASRVEEEADPPWTFTTSVFLPRKISSSMFVKSMKKDAAKHDFANIHGKKDKDKDKDKEKEKSLVVVTDQQVGHDKNNHEEKEKKEAATACSKGIETLFDDEVDQMAIQSLFEQQYDVILDNFRTYCCRGDSGPTIHDLSKRQWHLFCHDCKFLITSKNKEGILTEINSDLIYATAVYSGGQAVMRRTSFCEALCRLIKKVTADRNETSAKPAGEYVMEQIKKNAKRLCSDIFRESHLYILEIDNLLRADLLMLKSIHRKMSMQHPGMTLQKWINFCNDSFDNKKNSTKVKGQKSKKRRPHTVKDLTKIFGASCMPLVSDDFLEVVLTFADFLEAVCRYAKHLTEKPLTTSGENSSNNSFSKDRSANTGWSKIRQLTMFREVFLEKEGKFVSIQNGGLLSKSSRNRAVELQQEEVEEDRNKVEGVTNNTDGGNEDDGDNESTGISDLVPLKDPSQNNLFQKYLVSVGTTIEQMVQTKKKTYF